LKSSSNLNSFVNSANDLKTSLPKEDNKELIFLYW
jgi:hypothetical protein